MAEDLRNQDRRERRQFWQTIAHPDCRDPDHPGCSHCEDSNEEDDDDD